MENNYTKALSKANILFGIHCSMKAISILLLFIILYSIIWIKEKNLNYIKISAYIQLIIFLFIIAVILFTNNPNFFDMCLKCMLYIFLILSIFQIIFIILELFGLIQNFNNFIKFFHECSYYRTYNDIIDSKYQRICLFYMEDPYSEEPFKYLCYYNSEEEYYNKFCDGLFCKQNNNFNKNENDFIKCSGININLITFPDNNVFFQKEKILFDKKKNKKFYLCSRKKRIDEYKSDDNNDDDKLKNNNIECPDDNPSKKYIIYIYVEILLHILIDFLFIYEIFIIKNLIKIYCDMNENSQLKINGNTNDSQLNGSNNKVNNPSANQVITIIDKKKANNQTENSEDIKIEDSSRNNKNENNKKRNIKIDKNDNRYININQNIKMCKNTNAGSVLLIEQNPKIKDKLKKKGLKSKEGGEDNLYLYVKNKKHNKLKSSQFKHLINISIDNDEHNQNSSNKENNNENNNNRKIKNKKNREINIINKTINNCQIIKNIPINIRENEKCNKTTYEKNKKNFNFNTNEKYLYIPINNQIKIKNNNKKEKIKKQNESFDFNNYKRTINHSFDYKQNINKENTYIQKINKNIINDYNDNNDNDNNKNMNQNITEKSNNEILSGDYN